MKVGIDFLGPLKTTKSLNRYIIVLRDYATGYTETAATPDETAKTVIRFLTDVFTRFGFPNELVSDNGPSFAAKITKAWKEKNGVKEILITPYNPRANGLVERWNSTVTQMLRFYVNHRHDDWDIYLPYVTFAYNTADNPVTKCSPFFLFYGREPLLPLRVQVLKENQQTLTEYNHDLLQRAEEGRKILLKTKEELKRRSENYFDQVTQKIKPGAYIMIKKFTSTPDTSKKLEDKYEGPYLVLEQSGLNNFVIKKEGTKETVHASHIKPYKGRTPTTSNFSANPELLCKPDEDVRNQGEEVVNM